MNPFAWLKKFFTASHADDLPTEMERILLKPNQAVALKIDSTWELLHTRSRKKADRMWQDEGLPKGTEPMWYLRECELAETPLALLYWTSGGADRATADKERDQIMLFLANLLTKYRWKKGETETVKGEHTILFEAEGDLRVLSSRFMPATSQHVCGVYMLERNADETEAPASEAPG